MVAANELSLETAFLDTVTSDQESSWTVSLKLQDCELLFKLDMGAEVTAVAEEVYKTLAVVELKPTPKPLYRPSHQALKVLGPFTARLTHERLSTNQSIHCKKSGISNIRVPQETYRTYAHRDFLTAL